MAPKGPKAPKALDTTNVLEKLDEITQEKSNQGTTRATPSKREYQSVLCGCPICAEQLRVAPEKETPFVFPWSDKPYTGTMSDTEAASSALELVESLFTDLAYVRSMLLHGEQLIRKRWIKKSNTKRKAFLKQLRPEMTESYDPFNHTLFLACDRTLRKEHHDTLLLPWMTLDMLKGEAKVLQLLHHRISNAPEEWVTFDNYQILRGWQAGAFDEKLNYGCVTMHGENYGMWTPMDLDAVHNGDSYTAPRALLILEAQAIVARFLRDFVTGIFGADCVAVDTTSGPLALTALINSSSVSQTPETRCLEFGIDYYNEPISPPPLLNSHLLEQLATMVSEKVVEAKDHLWLFQTDPAYFYGIATYWHKNNMTTLPGAEKVKDLRLHNLAGKLVADPIAQLRDWEFLSLGLCTVRQEYETNQGIIEPGSRLPQSYSQAVGQLESMALHLLIGKSWLLKGLLYVSPAWKSMWKVKDYLGNGQQTASVPHGLMDELYHRLMALAAVCERPDTARYKDVAIILKSLDDYLANCDKTEARKIDAFTMVQ